MHLHADETRSSAARAGVMIAALALIAACSSVPTGQAPERTAPAGSAQPTAPQRPPRTRAERTTTPEPAEQRAVSERRARDYPEIETSETGFTITEQIRITGEVRANYERALQQLQQGRYEEGIALLRGITETAPDVTAPFIDLGIAYAQSGDLEQAETALLTALKLSPDHPIVHNELGILYRKTGRFAEARASYEEALAIYPGFHFANRNLAVLCDLYLADLDCALEHYQAYMESVVEDPEVTIWMADIRNRLGH